MQQAVELSSLLQFIEPPQGSDDALPTASPDPLVLDDLEVDSAAGSFLAEEHGGLRARLVDATMNLSNTSDKCQQYGIKRGTRKTSR